MKDHRQKLDELAAFLYEKETITGEEFMEILGRKENSGERILLEEQKGKDGAAQ